MNAARKISVGLKQNLTPFFLIIFTLLTLSSSIYAKTTVRPLKDSISAIRGRLETIRSAKKELIVSALDFEEDIVGDGFLAEIRAARARGVEVYWMLDNAVSPVLPGGGVLGV